MQNNTLEFTTDVFTLTDIEKAITAFSELAVISINTNGDRYIVRFSECKYPIIETMHEFDNYVIALSAKHIII